MCLQEDEAQQDRHVYCRHYRWPLSTADHRLGTTDGTGPQIGDCLLAKEESST